MKDKEQEAKERRKERTNEGERRVLTGTWVSWATEVTPSHQDRDLPFSEIDFIPKGCKTELSWSFGLNLPTSPQK